MIHSDDCGAISGMSGKGNRSTGRKPAPVPHYTPQITHDLTQVRTQAAVEGSQRQYEFSKLNRASRAGDHTDLTSLTGESHVGMKFPEWPVKAAD
jgi:hypothetical protein